MLMELSPIVAALNSLVMAPLYVCLTTIGIIVTVTTVGFGNEPVMYISHLMTSNGVMNGTPVQLSSNGWYMIALEPSTSESL